MLRIESLLSARLFLTPQLVGDRIFFISNLSGQLSLFAMDYGGSVPEPLLPPNIALQNPHLIDGKSFYVFPKIGKILVMIDEDGDENYQPMQIPVDGGYPEPTFESYFSAYRVHLNECDIDRNIIYLSAESRKEQMIEAYRCNLLNGELQMLGASPWGSHPGGHASDHSQVILIDGYSMGDDVLYLWDRGAEGRKLLYGTPLDDRSEDQDVPLSAFFSPQFVENDRAIILGTALFSDTFGLGYLDLQDPTEIKPVEFKGIQHQGVGEFEDIIHLNGNRYLLKFNIDGCTWLYEGIYDDTRHCMELNYVICGLGLLANGVMEAVSYDEAGDRFILSFSTATSPTQIFTVEGPDRNTVLKHTNERILGIPSEYLSPGEDASYSSFDGTRISARLYMPAPSLGYQGPRPVVYYVHGGPQGQERPDFAWFSMPLIQFLALNGFAVFVPNVRGSTGYGLSYTKQVDHDWGGKDRLDHVHAMKQVLPNDARLDVTRAGVVGRSYGGYMTLTLAGRHPDLWSAAVDMFGPYDLLTFMDRIPVTWKPYFKIVLGDPENPADREFLEERSPKTYLHQLEAPLLVIQGKNDPRVVERESRDVVENLRSSGKEVSYLMFENEGHDVLKYENRVACYNAITDYFKKHLMDAG
jgi:pimeloyl-ACP methyl ester carboxylesterase